MPALRAAANSPNIIGQWERSTDGVAFVNQVLAGLTYLWMDERTPTKLLALTAATTIQRSTDGGDIWAALAALPAAGHHNSCCEHSLGAVLVGQPANAAGEIRVFRSLPPYVAWSDILVATRIAASSRVYPGTFWEADDGSILMHDDPNAAAADLSRVYRSTTQGATWATVLSPGAGAGATQGSLTYLPRRALAYFLTDDGVNSLKLYRSSDHGQTWADVAPAGMAAQNLLGASTKVRNAVARLANGQHAMCTGASFWRSSDAGLVWVEDAPSSPGGSTRGGPCVTLEGSIFVVRDIAGATIRRSIDNGASWVTLSTIQQGATNAAAIYAAVAAVAGGSKIPRMRR